MWFGRYIMVILFETVFLATRRKMVVSNGITTIYLSEPHKQCTFISILILTDCIMIVIRNDIEIKPFYGSVAMYGLSTPTASSAAKGNKVRK